MRRLKGVFGYLQCSQVHPMRHEANVDVIRYGMVELPNQLDRLLTSN